MKYSLLYNKKVSFFFNMHTNVTVLEAVYNLNYGQTLST